MLRVKSVGNAVCVGLALVCTSFAAIPAQAAETINLLTWEGYADASFVKPFTEKTGCGVQATYVGSGDEFVAKMTAAASTYDLVSPGSDITMRLVDAGVIDPVDLGKISNAGNLSPIFQKPAWLEKDGKSWGVPYTFGIIRIVVDPKSFKETPTSLKFLWDPARKGKISLWDDLETVYMAARAEGVKNPYEMSDAELETVKAKLIGMKGNVRKYWFTAGELDTLLQSGDVDAGNAWETNLINAWKGGRELVEVKPAEGRGAWSDSWMISKGAGTKKCVYEWLNWSTSPEAQALGNAVTGFGYSNPKMIDGLDAKSKEYMQRLGMGDPAILKEANWWQPVSRRGQYLELWNQVKAAPN
jgi:spermidine/putrescine-binding protein